jgi:DNA modification methylase
MYQILEGEVIEQLKTMADASVDSIVTDPPYGLEFMGKDWDAPWKTDHRQGFDGTMQIPDSPFGRSKVRNGNGASYGADAHVMQSLQNWHFAWASEALRVLKPGGYLLAFGGSRTYHRLACAVEDAGFEIRDQIMWIYGSGFPKSLDVSKAIDKMAGAKRAEGSEGKHTSRRPREAVSARSTYSDSVGDYKSSLITMPVTDMAQQWSGWGTALKPSHEPVVVARKPLIGTVAANVLKYETGALNIDACRVGAFVNTTPSGVDRRNQTLADMGYRPNTYQVGRSELSGAVGRWPANVIHDGSEEVLAAFPDAPGALGIVTGEEPSSSTQDIYGNFKKRARSNPRDGDPSAQRRYATKGATNFAALPGERRIDSGSAARFFYCAKASREERNMGCEGLGKKPLLWSSGTQSPGTFQAAGTDRSAQNNHPTVKPIALMTYLCRLVTPPQGTVLDLFMGSGSTGIAALREKFNFIGIEVNPEYVEIARRRIESDAPLFNKEG